MKHARPRSRVCGLGGAMAALVLTGCATRQPPLPPPDLSAHPVVAATPVIDIHTHTFNARYLPLEGVLLGKRDAAAPWSWLLTDGCAKDIAAAFVGMTELSPLEVAGVVASRQPEMLAAVEARGGLICKLFIGILRKAVEKQVWAPDATMEEQKQRLEEVMDQMSALEKSAVKAAVRMMGFTEHEEHADSRSELRAATRFLWMLTQDDARMPEMFRHDYGYADPAAAPLMVSHMMDLGPVYDQQADGETLLSFGEQQVERMRAQMAAEPAGGLLYFVAYNPYRRGPESGKDDDSALRLVRTAVEERGAWGVKVYPPSGYRPAGNQIKKKPFAPATRYPGRQWAARYGPDLPEADAALDRRLERLLLWCIETDTPVFAHCSTAEFEARKGYGVWHADPRFWRRFLETHPEPDGSPCRLRLSLGHAGGGDYWYEGGKYSEWGRTVYELCTAYPNVYCEITVNSRLIDEGRRAAWVARLAECFADSAPGGAGGRAYDFSKKLLYGTDWYLPDAGERIDVLNAVRGALLGDARLSPHFADYFYRNALRYLNVEAALADPARVANLPPALRDRLGRLAATTPAAP